MNNKYLNTIIICILLLSFAGKDGKSQDVGESAPEISLQTLEGETFTLSENKGKVVFIFLFGYNCPHCISNGPNTESLIYQVFKDNEDFVAVGIDTWNGNASGVESYKSRAGLTYPLCLNGSDVMSEYKTTYDRILVVDRDGVLRFKATANASTSVTAQAAEIIEDLLDSGTTGISEISQNQGKLKIYPNPVRDIATIQTGFDAGEKLRINIIDLSGKVKMDVLQATGINGDFKLDLSGYSPGVYFLKTTYNGRLFISKLIVGN